MSTEIDSALAIELIKDHLQAPEHSWSVGIPGAIAEFMHDAGEEIELTSDRLSVTARTPRGTLSVRLPEKIHCIAFEEFSPCIKSWSQQIAFCQTGKAAKQTANQVLTELSSEQLSTTQEHHDESWFDLGLGSEYLRFCIRTNDKGLLSALRQVSGQSIFAPQNTIMSMILDKSPVRIISTALASIEIRGKIPGASEMSPSGPHTHLLPKFLNSEKLLVPLPDGLRPLLTLYPSHPLFDKYGVARSFNSQDHQHFQNLLKQFGLPEYCLEKSQLNQQQHEKTATKPSHWQKTAQKVNRLQQAHIN